MPGETAPPAATGLRALLGARRKRGGLEVGLVALVALLVAGAIAGTGLSQTVLATADPLAWLANLRGELTLVNPETGTAVERLQVAADGDPLQVTQDGQGLLVVTNLATNEVTVIDVSMLRVIGSRSGNPGVKVLLADHQIYLVDKVAGQIEQLDPLTAATRGQPWRAGVPLADAAVDGRGAVSALDQTGKLVTLEWSGGSGGFVERDRRDLPQPGADSVLVGNELGVTAANPGGAVSQVGAGGERNLTAPGLAAPLAAPDRSPAALVPIASPGSTSVHIVRPDRVVRVDGNAIDCEDPDEPAAYRGLVYLPCRGERKVLVLDREGRPAEPELSVPGDAELVLHAGLLVVNVPDAATGLVVKPDGTVQEIRTHDPSVPIHDPAARPTALPPELALPPTLPAEQPRDEGGQAPEEPPGDPEEPDAPEEPDDPREPDDGPADPLPINPDVPVVPDPSGPGTPDPGTPGPATPGPGTPGPGTPGPGTPGPGTPGPGTPGPGTPGPGTPGPASPSPSPPDSPSPSPTPPDPEDFRPTGVTATNDTNGGILVSWTAPVNPPDSYRILRTDTGAQVASPPVGATSAPIGGLPLGVRLSFVVEATTGGQPYPSAPSDPPIAAVAAPGAPTVSVELAALSPASLTVRVSVSVANDGGSPVSTYDLSGTTSTGGSIPGAQGVPIGQPHQASYTCNGPRDVCLRGGGLTVRATVNNGIGTAQGESTLTVPAPPGFGFGRAFMYVSTGLKCLDVDLRLHTCTGNAGQLWNHVADRNAIRNRQTGQCLAVNDTLHLADDGCDDDEKEFTRQAVDGNEAVLFSPDGGECVFVNGDPAGEGVQVLDRRNCPFGANDRWTAWLPPGGVPLAAAAPAAFVPPHAPAGPARDGALGGTMTALLLLVLAATALRLRARRRR